VADPSVHAINLKTAKALGLGLTIVVTARASRRNHPVGVLDRRGVTLLDALFRNLAPHRQHGARGGSGHAQGRVILSRHLHVTEVRHGAAAVDLPRMFQGHLT
jgi:hypothetical protein